MRMQKEEKIVVVLLLMALGSLAVAFWAFSPEDGGQKSSSDSMSQKDAGLSVEGLVLEIKPTKSGGNLLLKLDSTPASDFHSCQGKRKGASSSDSSRRSGKDQRNRLDFSGQR